MNEELLQQLAAGAGDRVVDNFAEFLGFCWEQIDIEPSEHLRFISEQIPEEIEPPYRILKIIQVDRHSGIRTDYREGEFVYIPISFEEDGTVISKGTYDEDVIEHELGDIRNPQIFTEEGFKHYTLRILIGLHGLGGIHDQLAEEGIPHSRITVETNQGTMSRVEIAEYKGETLFTLTPSV